jgi:hypothetical protein
MDWSYISCICCHAIATHFHDYNLLTPEQNTPHTLHHPHTLQREFYSPYRYISASYICDLPGNQSQFDKLTSIRIYEHYHPTYFVLSCIWLYFQDDPWHKHNVSSPKTQQIK